MTLNVCFTKKHTVALFQGQLGSVSSVTAFTTFPEKTSKSLLSMVNTEIKNTMSTVLVNYTLYILFKNPCIMVIKGNLDIGIIMCVWLGEQERYAWVAIDLYINLSQTRKRKANTEPWN